MQPKISVIVPVYKAEKYLHRCVDSILAQTFTDFELILVNDCSPDNCGAIFDEYAKKDNRVRVIHKENGGVSSARNLGLDNAQGEWITFVDADDYIENGFLDIPDSVQEDLLIQNYKVLGDESYDIGEFTESTISTVQIQNFINTNIEKQFLKTPWAKFFKRDIIQKNEIRFPYGVKIGEDTLFVLDYLYYTKSVNFLASANYLYYYDKNCIDRYRLSAEKAIEIHHLLIERYKKLNVRSIQFLHYAFIYYYNLILPKDYKSVRRWKNDRIVRQTYKTTRHTYTRKWNIKYRFHLLYTRYTILRNHAAKN